MKEGIIIRDKSFFEDLIWMSYRYCIGRKTIACSMHAGELVKYMKIFDENKRSQFCHDIRRMINDCIRFEKNVTISGYADDLDAYSILLKYIKDNNLVENQYSFRIDLDNYDIIHTKSDEKFNNNIESLYVDLIPWIRLADYLDDSKHKKVIYKDKEIECFPTLYNDQNICKYSYLSIADFEKNPFNLIFLDEKYFNI